MEVRGSCGTDVSEFILQNPVNAQVVVHLGIELAVAREPRHVGGSGERERAKDGVEREKKKRRMKCGGITWFP